MFDERNATADELWEWCLLEYKSSNFLARRLFDGFFSNLRSILSHAKATDRVLEVGCGAGESSDRVIKMIGQAHFEVSDYDERYVSKIRQKKPHLNVSRESVYALEREDASFDWVVMLEVLEHLEQPETALRELFRVSRKNVVISVPREPLWRTLNMLRGRYISDWGNTPGHLQHFSAARLRRLIGPHANIVQIRKPVPWLMVWARKKTAASGEFD